MSNIKDNNTTTMKASDCISGLSVDERIALAHRAGEQLHPQLHDHEKYHAARRLGEVLASDLCQQVRETLAFELRKYRKLPKSIAAKIACDIDEIAVPFLRVTPALSDALMAELIPLLSDNTHLAVAARSDLGMKACRQLIRHANDNAALRLISNASVEVDETLASLVLDYFGEHSRVIKAVVKRPNLPLSVVIGIFNQVGAHLRRDLIEAYGVDTGIARCATVNSVHEAIWRKIRHATPGQVHACVIDLRQNAKLTPDLMLAMAERGSTAFLESALAIMSAHTVTDVREVLHLANPKQFQALMNACSLARSEAKAVYKLACRLYGAASSRRKVGNPALWQSRPSMRLRPLTAA